MSYKNGKRVCDVCGHVLHVGDTYRFYKINGNLYHACSDCREIFESNLPNCPPLRYSREYEEMILLERRVTLFTDPESLLDPDEVYPFCKCGCGKRVLVPLTKYLPGHRG